MQSIISVENLSKKYRIKHVGESHFKTLRETLTLLPKKLLLGKRTKPYSEEFWALNNVNFDVKVGERLGIIGHNGAGKSTLLKLLSRITAPSMGKITIRGKLASLLEVGTGFHPELTGRENIFLNGAILGMPRREILQKFDAIVEFSGVEQFLDTPVKRYSSGMYVRLAFAVAAHLEPEILVIDEVLAVGDAEFQKKCLGKMGELSSSGRTILFVTHNLDAMQTLCSRSIILEKGAVEFDGSPDDARKLYISKVSSAEYSVARNAGRGGSGGVAIDSVSAESANGLSEEIESGDFIRLFLSASVYGNYRSQKDLEVAFGVDTIDGHRVFTVLSSWSSLEIDATSGNINVACDIDSLPLIPGRYLVSATIIFRGDTLESVQHCAFFDVSPKCRSVHVERHYGWGILDLPCSFKNVSNALLGEK